MKRRKKSNVHFDLNFNSEQAVDDLDVSHFVLNEARSVIISRMFCYRKRNAIFVQENLNFRIVDPAAAAEPQRSRLQFGNSQTQM